MLWDKKTLVTFIDKYMYHKYRCFFGVVGGGSNKFWIVQIVSNVLRYLASLLFFIARENKVHKVGRRLLQIDWSV